MLLREIQIRIWFDQGLYLALRCGSSRGSNHGGAGSRKERIGKPNLTGTEIQPGWIHPRQDLGLVSQRDLGFCGTRQKGFGPDDSGASALQPPRFRPRQTGWASAQSAEDSSPGNGGFVPRKRRIRPPTGRSSDHSEAGALVFHSPHSEADRRSARVSRPETASEKLS